MKTWIAKLLNFAVLSVLLPLYGCQGGGGGSSFSSLGSLFGASGPLAGGGDGGTVVGGGDVAAAATLHNPEPATLILLGSGIAAMAMLKKNQKR